MVTAHTLVSLVSQLSLWQVHANNKYNRYFVTTCSIVNSIRVVCRWQVTSGAYLLRRHLRQKEYISTLNVTRLLCTYRCADERAVLSQNSKACYAGWLVVVVVVSRRSIGMNVHWCVGQPIEEHGSLTLLNRRMYEKTATKVSVPLYPSCMAAAALAFLLLPMHNIHVEAGVVRVSTLHLQTLGEQVLEQAWNFYGITSKSEAVDRARSYVSKKRSTQQVTRATTSTRADVSTDRDDELVWQGYKNYFGKLYTRSEKVW